MVSSSVFSLLCTGLLFTRCHSGSPLVIVAMLRCSTATQHHCSLNRVKAAFLQGGQSCGYFLLDSFLCKQQAKTTSGPVLFLELLLADCLLLIELLPTSCLKRCLTICHALPATLNACPVPLASLTAQVAPSHCVCCRSKLAQRCSVLLQQC